MKKALSILLMTPLFFLTVLSAYAASTKPLIQFVPHNSPLVTADQDNYRFAYSLAGEDVYISKERQSKKMTFLFLLPKTPGLLSNVMSGSHGKLLGQSGKLAVVEVDDLGQIEPLAAELHHETMACGNVVLLQSKSDKPVFQTSTPVLAIDGTADSKVKETLANVSAKRIGDHIREMQGWQNRFHRHAEGQKTAARLAELYRQFIPKDRTDVTIEKFSHSRSPQKSLIVRIRGTSKPDEVVILGSHLDAIVGRGHGEFTPGADDDASGTVTALEVFIALMQKNIRPQRTIEIHAYAAEEIGLVGSGEIASSYRGKNKDVKAMMQMDMNLFSKNNQVKIFFVTNSTNETLTGQMIRLVETYQNVQYGKKPLWFGSSDHASWHREGYNVVFPTEDPQNFNFKIHTEKDTVDYAFLTEQSAAHGKLGVSYLMHYAGYQANQ